MIGAAASVFLICYILWTSHSPTVIQNNIGWIAAELVDTGQFMLMDAEIAALEAKLAKARQVKQGMMQELLTGRIRLV